MQSSCSNIYLYISFGCRNCYYNLRPNFWSHCFNSPELKAQVRYDNEYIDGLLSLFASIFKGVYISSDQIECKAHQF